MVVSLYLNFVFCCSKPDFYGVRDDTWYTIFPFEIFMDDSFFLCGVLHGLVKLLTVDACFITSYV